VSRVFDFNEMKEIFGTDPEGALKLLAANIRAGVMDVDLRDVQAIGGGVNDADDTVRLILDLKMQLVKT